MIISYAYSLVNQHIKKTTLASSSMSVDWILEARKVDMILIKSLKVNLSFSWAGLSLENKIDIARYDEKPT